MRAGFTVDVLTIDTSGKLESECTIEGVKIRRFKSSIPSFISDIYNPSLVLWKYLLRNSSKYDIVHAHNYHALPSLFAANTKGLNHFVFSPHYHGAGSSYFRNLLHIPYKFFGLRIFNRADKIICVSDYEKNLLRKLSVDERRITVIPNGLNIDQFTGIQRSKRAFRRILYVGRLEKYKGIQFILEALAKLEDNIVVEIVGVGPYKGELIKLASDLRIENKVKFYYNLSQKELIQKYVDAEIFIMLSTRESYGITVAEALSLGTPCIVSNSSALKEWVDGQNCFGIDDPRDINELVNLIHRVSGKTADYGSLQKRIHSWDYVTEQVIKIYESLN